MTATISEPGIYADLDERSYHAHRGSLSSTGAKILLGSPKRYQYQLDHPTEPTPAMEFGTAVHTLVLGAGAPLRVVDAASWRGKAAAEEQAQARASGEVPILAADHETAQAMAAAVRGHETAARLLAAATEREVSLFAPDSETRVVRRGRVDALAPRFTLDLKTARDASPASWWRTVASSGYDLQAAWYLGLLADLGHTADKFIWVAVEKEPPYLVGVHQASPAVLDDGRALARHALDVYARCADADHWPDFPGLDINHTQAAPWRAREIEDLIEETA